MSSGFGVFGPIRATVSPWTPLPAVGPNRGGLLRHNSMCTVNLKRMSLGTGHDALACMEENNGKRKPAAKRNVKRPKFTMRKRVPGQSCKRVLPCFDMNEVSKPRLGYKKPKMVAIWATCILCKYKNPECKAFGAKTKITHCPSWFRCVEHV